VVIRYFYIIRVAIDKFKTYPPLVIDRYGVLPFPISPETLTHLFSDFRFSLLRGADDGDGAVSADDAQRQVRHQVEQQDADFKQGHACVVDGVKPFLG